MTMETVACCLCANLPRPADLTTPGGRPLHLLLLRDLMLLLLLPCLLLLLLSLWRKLGLA